MNRLFANPPFPFHLQPHLSLSPPQCQDPPPSPGTTEATSIPWCPNSPDRVDVARCHNIFFSFSIFGFGVFLISPHAFTHNGYNMHATKRYAHTHTHVHTHTNPCVLLKRKHIVVVCGDFVMVKTVCFEKKKKKKTILTNKIKIRNFFSVLSSHNKQQHGSFHTYMHTYLWKCCLCSACTLRWEKKAV